MKSNKPYPSAWSHLHRLLGVLGVCLLLFLGFVYLASPDSWHYDMSYWHRAQSLEDMKHQPLIYGGIEEISTSKRNVACKTCHKDVTKAVRKLKHKSLSCESCHGPLYDHVRDGNKVGEAIIDRTPWQCKNCHSSTINKPADHPQFKPTKEFKKHMAFVAGEFKPGTTCYKCHDAHDPTP